MSDRFYWSYSTRQSGLVLVQVYEKIQRSDKPKLCVEQLTLDNPTLDDIFEAGQNLYRMVCIREGVDT